MATQHAQPLNWAPVSPSSITLHRPLGDSEYAFFRNSSTGVGDMFLHLTLRAPRDIMRRERVRIAWGSIRVAHPLLMSKVRVEGGDTRKAKFCFRPPIDEQEVLDEAEHALHYRRSSKDELIFGYMNGPRSLSDDHLSYLVVSSQDSATRSGEAEYDLFMCAPHFTGDGTSLHQSTHDLLVLLASPKSDAELRQNLGDQLERAHASWPDILPPAFESRLSVPSSSFTRAAHKVNFLQAQQHEIGDHVFPRVQHSPRRTRLVENSFNEEETKAILSACKRNGVSVNNALFALCNVAWARVKAGTGTDGNKLPMMMYSAINLRPFLSPMPPAPAPTYWFLALTYFTVVLPSFPPSPTTFWHRARLAKAQTTKNVKSPFLPARALAMATQRASASTPVAQLPPHARASSDTGSPTPSRALLGLSLIGNLDQIYTPSSYVRPGVYLRSVTTASRQKAGGLLVLEHTFAGRLWLHLCWDECGFEEGMIESWWKEVVSGVKEFLR